MIHYQNIFITGASGFIGRNLVYKLLCQDNQIHALIRENALPRHDSLKIVTGDLLDPESFFPELKRGGTLFHCAAHISFRKGDFEQAYQVNVEGTRNVLEASYRAGIKKVVHLSACAVLGFSPDPDIILDEKSYPMIERDNVYAYTKKLAEKEVKKYAQKGLDVSIASIATVYGPGDRSLNSGAIIKAIYAGKMKLIPPGGTSFVSVDDLVEGLILLAEKGRAGERYIFCNENMTYKDLVRRIAGTLNVKAPRYTLPGFSYYPASGVVKALELFSRFKKGNVNLMTAQILKEVYGYKYFSSRKASRELGWKPARSFEETVKQAFNYYQENGLIPDSP